MFADVPQQAVATPSTIEVAHVDLTYLAGHENVYLGKGVSTHGCLIYAFHGLFIHPCRDANWRHIILLDIPDSKWNLIGEITRPMRPIPDKLDVEGEADFIGTIVQQNARDQLGNEMKNKILVLRLQDVRNPQIFRKH